MNANISELACDWGIYENDESHRYYRGFFLFVGPWAGGFVWRARRIADSRWLAHGWRLDRGNAEDAAVDATNRMAENDRK